MAREAGATVAVSWLGEERQELAVDRILEAAGEVFAEDGIRGARMGRIAEGAGCARATLYRYFPNKEALLQAYMTRIAGEFDEVLQVQLDCVDALGERLVEAVATSVELIWSRQDVAPFFTEEGVGLTAQLASNATSLRKRLARRIEQESRSKEVRGTLRDGVSPSDAAEWVTRTILSFAMLQSPERSGPSLRRYLRKMLLPTLVRA